MFKHDNYLNKDIYFFMCKELFEYDIQSAGFNILKRYRILSDDIITQLETMNKKDRQIYIGTLIRINRDIGIKLNEGFIETRRLFFEANRLQSSDVLSIKKDAIFTFKRCPSTEFDNIKFIEKNIYTSYYYLNKKEFYYNSFNLKLDVKGISNETLELHTKYMMEYFIRIFRLMEVGSPKSIINYIKEFSSYYKQRKLEVGYYREFNSKSKYLLDRKYSSKSNSVYVVDVSDAERDMLDISYNYMNYNIPMIAMIV